MGETFKLVTMSICATVLTLNLVCLINDPNIWNFISATILTFVMSIIWSK